MIPGLLRAMRSRNPWYHISNNHDKGVEEAACFLRPPFFIWRFNMALELRTLIEKVQHMDITLVAGEAGLSHLVSWVHMVETVEASDFLDGGQLAFTTGIGLGSGEELMDLLHAFARKKVAGVIINTGPFIEKIPQEAIDFCEKQGLPLLVVPWKVHLAEIMRICCYAITKEDQRSMETAAAFKNAIMFPKQEELYVVPLSQRSFSVS